jgi:hypothetical protein
MTMLPWRLEMRNLEDHTPRTIDPMLGSSCLWKAEVLVSKGFTKGFRAKREYETEKRERCTWSHRSAEGKESEEEGKNEVAEV